MKKAILVVGNDLRSDDGVGIKFGEEIKKNFKDWTIFWGRDTPENEFFALEKFSPDFLLIVDATIEKNQIFKPNAEFLEFNEPKFLNDFIFGTHNIPLEFFIKFLNEISKKTLFLAIFVDENNLNFGENLTKQGKISLQIAIEKFKKLNENLN